MMIFTKTVVLLVATLFMTPAFAQNAPADKPADNTQILRDKIKADKKLVVAANMELTESEAKGFWPVYDAYQKDLEAINKRMVAMIKSYADAYNTKSMDNEKAKKLTSDFLAIQADEVKHMQSYVPKLNKVLPATKVARYLQIENKIRTIIKNELVDQVPLVPGK
jgi:Skp family chaperone for outer membrane proteins